MAVDVDRLRSPHGSSQAATIGRPWSQAPPLPLRPAGSWWVPGCQRIESSRDRYEARSRGRMAQARLSNRLDRPVDQARDHVLGAPDAEITLVEYGSYACP